MGFPFLGCALGRVGFVRDVGQPGAAGSLGDCGDGHAETGRGTLGVFSGADEE